MLSFKTIAPVIPVADMKRDVNWYLQYAGFQVLFANSMYAVLQRDEISMHLQWHADTPDDPLNGGSVVRIFVPDINPVFDEFVQRETITRDALKLNTAWHTHEFGFYDLNRNAIFIVQDMDE